MNEDEKRDLIEAIEEVSRDMGAPIFAAIGPLIEKMLAHRGELLEAARLVLNTIRPEIIPGEGCLHLKPVGHSSQIALVDYSSQRALLTLGLAVSKAEGRKAE